jgi:epoxyqueuosine reductase
MEEDAFREKYKGSPAKRAKRRGLLRNAAVALAESDHPEVETALNHAVARDPEPLVREHAEWALGRSQARKHSQQHIPVRE